MAPEVLQFAPFLLIVGTASGIWLYFRNQRRVRARQLVAQAPADGIEVGLCPNCGADLAGMFCAKCGAHHTGQVVVDAPAVSLARTEGEIYRLRELERRLHSDRHGVPLLLSFFIPGLGQMVKGQFLSGLAVMFMTAVFGFLCVFGFGIPLLLVLWIAQLYDAYVKPDASTVAELKRLGR